MEPSPTNAATDLSVEEWLTQWLTDEVRPAVRPRTYLQYEATVRRHLIPSIGHHMLKSLSAADVKAFILNQVAKGLSPATIRSQHSILRRALQVAMRDDRVGRNVARLVSPAHGRASERVPLDRSETATLLETAAGERLGALFIVAVATGMRLGELIGLTWKCVDLEAGYIRVEHLLARYGGAYHLDPPKTVKSRRAIAVPSPVVDALLRHQQKQSEARRLLGRDWQGNDWDLVFTTQSGGPLSPTTVEYIFKRLLKDSGLRKVRFHDLRHGAATLLLAQGVQMKVVQDVLGHAQMQMTADLYSHVVPELRRDAADRIGDALFGKG